ncbi:unnamed protein product, partial [Iphiclides podalirius]
MPATAPLADALPPGGLAPHDGTSLRARSPVRRLRAPTSRTELTVAVERRLSPVTYWCAAGVRVFHLFCFTPPCGDNARWGRGGGAEESIPRWERRR